MGILVCKAPKGVTGRRETGGTGRSLRTQLGTAPQNTQIRRQRTQETNPDDSRGSVAGWRDSSAPDK